MGVLDGKAALITGAGSGIGLATAHAFAAEGARVLCADLDRAKAEAAATALRDAGARAEPAVGDAADPAVHERWVAESEAAFGALHIAVNNAGMVCERHATGGYPLEAWDRVIALNLSGVFYGLRAQLPAMARAGGGAAVNISSIMGQVTRAGIAPYTASKHAVVGLTKAAALDHAADGIRVNAVGPGYIRTPLIGHVSDDDVGPLHPIGRLGRPEEVAALILWLCSPAASFATGAYYPIDGGYLAQ